MRKKTVPNTNKGSFSHRWLLTKWAVIPSILFFSSCHSTRNVTTFVKTEDIEYRDTTIEIPLVTKVFEFESLQFDTILTDQETTVQIVHDSTGGRLYVLHAPQTIQLDSVIRNVTIRETYRTTVQKHACDSKFHQFTSSFFKWTISIVIFYVGMKAIFK